MINDVQAYTEGQLIVTQWSWSKEDVIAGESAGLCISPDDNGASKASCWQWAMGADGKFGSTTKSFLISIADVKATTSLDSMQDLGALAIPTLFGSWICSSPVELAMRVQTVCTRFLPKTDTTNDPAYKDGQPIIATTYLSSRLSGRVKAPATVNGNPGALAEGRGFVSFNTLMATSMDMGLAGKFFDGAITGLAEESGYDFFSGFIRRASSSL